MAYGDYINLHNLQDTGAYISSSNGQVGNQKNLRFIVQPIHCNDQILIGGNGNKTRDTWGSDGSTDADDYCNFLMGTAESMAGVSYQPNSPNGLDSDRGHGAKQHHILVIYSDDDFHDTTGGIGAYVSDVNTRFEFTLQTLHRSGAFEDTISHEMWLTAIGSPTDTYISQGTNGTWGVINPVTQKGLLDYYVDFVPLFDPGDLNALNPALDNWTFEDECTGVDLQQFALADRFSLVHANTMSLSLFSLLDGTDPRFNNLPISEKKRRIFITKEPIQSGLHATTNKMVRPHVDGTYGGHNYVSAGTFGPGPQYGSLQEAVQSQFDVPCGFAQGYFDVHSNSYWNLIIKDNITGDIQHIGDME